MPPACQPDGVLAISSPAHPFVYVCGERFRAAWMCRPGTAEEAVIHEALHTIGLGEDPPTREEITAQIRKRCG